MGRKRNGRVVVGMCAVLALGSSVLASAATAAGPATRPAKGDATCARAKRAVTRATKAVEKADKSGDLEAYKKAQRDVERAEEERDDCIDKEARVRLEPINTRTRKPFTQPTGQDSQLEPVTVTQPTALDPSQVGIYGGTLNKGECDKEQLKTFLQQNPAQGSAWAEVLGITPQEIPAYIDRLTPITLLSDTLVTNHDFKKGKAVPLQSTLQAGTAVLVDEHGTPVTKCYCGNPLQPPVYTPPYYPPPNNTTTTTYYDTTTTTYYEPPTYGPKWPKYYPPGITVILVYDGEIEIFVLYDFLTGKTFNRPAGSDGSADTPTSTAPPKRSSPSPKPSTTTTTYPHSTTTTKKDPYCYPDPMDPSVIICA